jgi:hypothetical protein
MGADVILDVNSNELLMLKLNIFQSDGEALQKVGVIEAAVVGAGACSCSPVLDVGSGHFS